MICSCLIWFSVTICYCCCVGKVSKVGEDSSQNLLAPSWCLPVSPTGVAMSPPGRRPFWSSTKRNRAKAGVEHDILDLQIVTLKPQYDLRLRDGGFFAL